MSELIKGVRKMLTQAQSFAKDAPLEAVTRTELALRTARGAFSYAQGEERDELATLVELGENRLERYRATLATWSDSVRTRAALFLKHERERLQNPLPPKV